MKTHSLQLVVYNFLTYWNYRDVRAHSVAHKLWKIAQEWCMQGIRPYEVVIFKKFLLFNVKGFLSLQPYINKGEIWIWHGIAELWSAVHIWFHFDRHKAWSLKIQDWTVKDRTLTDRKKTLRICSNQEQWPRQNVFAHEYRSVSRWWLHLLPPPRRICNRRCLSVCLRKNFRTDLHEIFREGWQQADEQMIKFWWRLGSGSVSWHW